MKLNKAWLASVIVFFIAEVVKKYNVSLPQGWEETAFSVALYIVQYGSFAFAAMWDKYILHKPIPAAPEPPTVEYKNYTDMVPVMKEVNAEINNMLKEIQSGKYTAATQEAIDTYLKIQALIKKKGA